jgi:hypothetical protein
MWKVRLCAGRENRLQNPILPTQEMVTRMSLLARLEKDRSALGRMIRNHHYERASDGVRMRNGLFIGGHAEVAVNGGPWEVAPNLVTNQGIDYLLSAALNGGTPDSGWHLAPYFGTASPVATVTAATFNATMQEFQNYAETPRPAWTVTAGAQSLSNATAAALITINQANQTVRGIGVMSVGTKLAGSGFLLAIAPFASAKTALGVDDTLSLIYTLTGADGGP